MENIAQNGERGAKKKIGTNQFLSITSKMWGKGGGQVKKCKIPKMKTLLQSLATCSVPSP